MPRTIVIDPVTRLEGHGKITLQLDEAGVVQDATFHVTQLRGFEKFTEGRPFYEMPNITARICGICPVSHLVASSKACDAILAVKIPPVAKNLRQIMNLAQLIQSHALSFFYLCCWGWMRRRKSAASCISRIRIRRLGPMAWRCGNLGSRLSSCSPGAGFILAGRCRAA
jgi:coenzyme F420-reducing hydrogenase alpha subunit